MNLDVGVRSCFPPTLTFPRAHISQSTINSAASVTEIRPACRHDEVTLDGAINSLGLLFMVLFMTLSVVALTPFQCLDSPNGTMSMSSNPSVLCNDNSTFISLAIVGILGVLVYCVGFFALLVYITVQYPAWIASGRGHMMHSSRQSPVDIWDFYVLDCSVLPCRIMR